MKILVVDDDVRNVVALTTLLERRHVDVVSAGAGLAGVAMLRRTPDVDVVLVDMTVPAIDSYATIAAMRGLASSRDLPIIALTANVSPSERQRCIDAGASAYVVEPVEATDLLLVLGEWLPVTPTGQPHGTPG
jgi:CheY-like chemotaxis protein